MKSFDTCAILIANVIPSNYQGDDNSATFKVDASLFMNVTMTKALDWTMTPPSVDTEFEELEKSKFYFLEGAGIAYPALKTANSQTYIYVMNNST